MGLRNLRKPDRWGAGMLGLVIIVTAIIFAVIAPVLSLVKYYHPSKLNVWKNTFWIIVTIISWPLVPIIIAARRSDKIVLGLFWGSFIIMAVATWYWCFLHADKLLQILQTLQTGAK